jgi:hypothetical protein
MSRERSRRLGRRLRGAVTERWPAKITALVLALLLWLVVTLQAPAEDWVDVRLDLTVDSGYVLAEPLPHVRALVAGRGRDLIELAGTHPVARMEVAPAGADVAVIAFAASDVELPGGLEARVRDVRPRVLRLRLRRAP